jgi:TonB family protein
MIVLLLKVTLLLALALAAVGVMRRSSAAMRHLVCACGLAGALLLTLSLAAPENAAVFRISAIALPGAARATAGTPAATQTLWRALPWLWLTGTVLLLARLAVGHLRALRFLRTAGPHQVAFADVSVPIVIGLWRPKILLPREAEDWPEGRIEAALRHERAHISRGDLHTLLLAQLACAAYWFHPLVWILASQLEREQEHACDDAVILSGLAPDSYAEALVAAARSLGSNRLSLSPMVSRPMVTRKTFRARVARLLVNGAPNESKASTLRSVAAVCAVATVALGLVNGQEPQQRIYKVGRDISAPAVLRRVDPEYSELARRTKMHGTVLLSVVVGSDGMAHDVRVVKSLGGGLDEKALEAVRSWRFRPGRRNGVPVPVRAQIEVNFRLL